MDLNTYITFIGVSIILCTVPGPDMLYLLGRSMANGRQKGMVAALGINTGTYVHLLAAVLGLTAILAASSVAFTMVKWCGAAYLVYLGIMTLKANEKSLIITTSPVTKSSNWTVYWQGFLVDVLNPKVAFFYLAILPQFINPLADHPTRLLLVLGVTLNVVGFVANLLYVYFAWTIAKKLRNNRLISYCTNKTMGGLFVALGIKLAIEKQ